MLLVTLLGKFALGGQLKKNKLQGVIIDDRFELTSVMIFVCFCFHNF